MPIHYFQMLLFKLCRYLTGMCHDTRRRSNYFIPRPHMRTLLSKGKITGLCSNATSTSQLPRGKYQSMDMCIIGSPAMGVDASRDRP